MLLQYLEYGNEQAKNDLVFATSSNEIRMIKFFFLCVFINLTKTFSSVVVRIESTSSFCITKPCILSFARLARQK